MLLNWQYTFWWTLYVRSLALQLHGHTTQLYNPVKQEKTHFLLTRITVSNTMRLFTLYEKILYSSAGSQQMLEPNVIY